MGWFRSKLAAMAWLALLALTCQFVLSFTHVHTGKLAPPPRAVAASGGAAAGQPPAPDKDLPGPVDDFCAVCTNISLAGTLVLPVLAAIFAALLLTGIAWRPWTARAPVSCAFVPVNARGPPLA